MHAIGLQFRQTFPGHGVWLPPGVVFDRRHSDVWEMLYTAPEHPSRGRAFLAYALGATVGIALAVLIVIGLHYAGRLVHPTAVPLGPARYQWHEFYRVSPLHQHVGFPNA
jgi:hypothetical protein